MKRPVSAVILIALIIMSVNCSAETAVDRKSVYENALEYVELDCFEEALEQFENAGDYGDSAAWVLYLEGVLYLDEADDAEAEGEYVRSLQCVEECRKRMDRLKMIEFRDSAVLLKYSQARSYELQGYTQRAEDTYAEMFNIRDSEYRRGHLLRLSPPVALPDEAQPKLDTVSGIVKKSVSVYAGPGTDYSEETDIKVTEGMAIEICGSSGDWYLAEAEFDGKLKRFWISDMRVEKNQTVKKLGSEKTQVTLLADAALYYGPGEEYSEHTGKLYKGTQLTVYGEEAGFAMIECVYGGRKIRAWIASSDI